MTPAVQIKPALMADSSEQNWKEQDVGGESNPGKRDRQPLSLSECLRSNIFIRREFIFTITKRN
jgi:hypothetical protein